MVSALAVLAVALSTATVGAAPETTPMSGPPNTLPTPSQPRCARLGGCSTFAINPGHGPVGTNIDFTGVCGFRPALTDAVFAVDPLTPANPFTPGRITFAQGHLTAPGSSVGRFTGTIAVPSFLDGAPVMPGIYYVTGGCCSQCNGAIGVTYLDSRPFCVSDPDNPCGSWYIWLNGGLGSQYFFTSLFINQIANEFAPPVFAGLPPASSTTTTRPRVTTTTQPPPATTQPPPTTTTTCVPNPKPPPKVICG